MRKRSLFQFQKLCDFHHFGVATFFRGSTPFRKRKGNRHPWSISCPHCLTCLNLTLQFQSAIAKLCAQRQYSIQERDLGSILLMPFFFSLLLPRVKEITVFLLSVKLSWKKSYSFGKLLLSLSSFLAEEKLGCKLEKEKNANWAWFNLFCWKIGRGGPNI